MKTAKATQAASILKSAGDAAAKERTERSSTDSRHLRSQVASFLNSPANLRSSVAPGLAGEENKETLGGHTHTQGVCQCQPGPD